MTKASVQHFFEAEWELIALPSWPSWLARGPRHLEIVVRYYTLTEEDAAITCAKLAEVIRGAVMRQSERRGATPSEPQGCTWSKPDSPSRWAKVFKVSPATFIRYVTNGTIHAQKLSSKSYQVALPDIPEQQARVISHQK